MSNEKPISSFETKMRIAFFQSCVSRREREFLSFGLMLRDKNKNLFLSESIRRKKSKVTSFPNELKKCESVFSFLVTILDDTAATPSVLWQLSLGAHAQKPQVLKD